MEGLGLRIIARIRTDFPTKFGIPRQSGMINSLEGVIVFENEYNFACFRCRSYGQHPDL